MIAHSKTMDVLFLTPSECGIRNTNTPAVVVGHLHDYEEFQSLGVQADLYVRLSAYTELLAPLLLLADYGSIIIHRQSEDVIRVSSLDGRPIPGIDELLDDALLKIDPSKPVLEQARFDAKDGVLDRLVGLYYHSTIERLSV